MLQSKPYGDFSLDIQDRIYGEKKFVKAQLELTYACNLHCLHCYTDPLNRPDLLKKEMPTGQVLKLIDKMADEGIFWLCLTGGEVFMRKDFFTIYDHAYSKGFLLTLFTNGTPVTEKIADYLAEKRPFSIEVSFHGATPETFDKITQVKGSFVKCIEGIKRLLARNLPVKLKTKAMIENRHEIDKIRELVESFGLKFSFSGTIWPRLDGDTSSCDHRLPAEELISLEFRDAEENDGRCEAGPQGEEAAPTPPNKYRCACGKLHTHIDPYGQVGACTWSRRDRFHFAEKGIQQGMKELAEKLHADVYNQDSTCRSCGVHEHCEKKTEMAVYENGDAEKPVDYFCQLAYGRAEKNQEIIRKGAEHGKKEV